MNSFVSRLRLQYYWAFSHIKADQEEIWQIYRQFLVGSRKSMKKLICYHIDQIKAVIWALKQETCTCLDQLEEVFIPRFVQLEEEEVFFEVSLQKN